MTREELVNKAAFNYVNQGGTTAEWSDGWEDYSDAEYIEQAFKAGAEWEHKRLVEKACEWLISSFDQLHNEYGRRLEFGNQDVFIEAFKKAMEE